MQSSFSVDMCVLAVPESSEIGYMMLQCLPLITGQNKLGLQVTAGSPISLRVLSIA